jgi:hypothetical protein
VNGQPIRLHTVGDTLRLDADLVSNVRLDSLVLTQVGPAGNQVLWRAPDAPPAGLTVTPAFPDTDAASVFGGRRFHLTYKAQLLANSYRYQFHTLDRYQQATNFDAVFSFQTILQVNGQAILDGDFISPTALLTVLVRSPKPLDPPNELSLTVNGAAQPFTAAAAAGDASGREWVLAWDHAPYGAGTNDVKLVAQGGAVSIMSFRVAAIGAAVELRNVMAFPNPFDDDYLRALAPGYDVATLFSFDLISAAPADVTLRVYTISGRLIYQRTEHGLDARYHQLPWNGSDAEGFPLANGVYIYRLLANNGTGTAMQEGRIVKLRRPRRTPSPSAAGTIP